MRSVDLRPALEVRHRLASALLVAERWILGPGAAVDDADDDVLALDGNRVGVELRPQTARLADAQELGRMRRVGLAHFRLDDREDIGRALQRLRLGVGQLRSEAVEGEPVAMN